MGTNQRGQHPLWREDSFIDSRLAKNLEHPKLKISKLY